MLTKLDNYNIPRPGGGGPGPDFDPIIYNYMMNSHNECFDPESGFYDLKEGLDLRNFKDYIIVDEDIYNISD